MTHGKGNRHGNLHGTPPFVGRMEAASGARPLAADCRSPDGEPLLAIDNLGAGIGSNVMISSDGSSTRKLVSSDTTPIRWCVLGI